LLAGLLTLSPGLAGGAGVATTAELSAMAALTRVVEAWGQVTNFSAGVDVDTIDRLGPPSPPRVAKEAWKFNRVGGTNRFVRTRFLPMAGEETIESTNHQGGRLLAGATVVPLPPDSSLPGFEVRHFLQQMLAARPVMESSNAEVFVVTAKLARGEQLKAFFSTSSRTPYRVEKSAQGRTLFVLARTEEAAGGSLLPASDSMHFHENGRVTSTVLRSFSNTREFAEPSSPRPSTRPASSPSR
jgi:hypothetical protein